uniref:Uncharacterized protein n=1 Tax=Ciona savignyi TaxID=51511 RepID=H2ZKS1_CIOSA
MNEMEVFMKFPVNGTNLSYYHSFGITENWIIFHEQPLSYSVPRVLVGQFLWRGILSSFYEDNSKKSVFHVINKTTGLKLKTKYSAKGMFCFHHINAYETRGEDGNTFLVVDMCCSDQSPLWLFNTSHLRAEGKEIENWNFNLDRKKSVRPRRYVIPLDIPSDASQGSNLVTIRGCKATAILCVDGSVSLEHELLIPDEIADSNVVIELPRINYDYYNGRKYNYMYGVKGAKFVHEQLVKINVEKKE